VQPSLILFALRPSRGRSFCTALAFLIVFELFLLDDFRHPGVDATGDRKFSPSDADSGASVMLSLAAAGTFAAPTMIADVISIRVVVWGHYSLVMIKDSSNKK